MTNYAINNKLVQETELPPMLLISASNPINATGKDILVQQTTFRTDGSSRTDPRDRARPIADEFYWTNDAPDSLDKYGWSWSTKSECNINEQDGFYTYKCSFLKLCYFVHPTYYNLYRDYIQSQFIFTINTPLYTETPYVYVHHCSILGRDMNTFNMYLSFRLVEQLERDIIQWTRDIGHTFIRNAIPGGLGPSQLITNISYETNAIKLQMCVKQEYLYWTIETLVRNLKNLKRLGIQAFKFLFLMGESKLLKIAEVYPSITPENPNVSTYTVNDIHYKRELLNAPDIVFYLNEKLDLKTLIDELCRLFPNEYPISRGIPRFNIRLNNNVCFSVGGHNQLKFDSELPTIPLEYKHILESRNCDYNRLSQYLTGHDLLNEDCTPNAILSYTKLIPPYVEYDSDDEPIPVEPTEYPEHISFRNTFKSHGLLSYYDDIFDTLHIDPIIITAGKPKRTKRTKRTKRF